MLCPECGNHAANKAIRKLEETGQIGHSKKNVFTFDGNLEGRETATFNDNTFVKVANSPIALSTVTLVRGVSPVGVEEITANVFTHDVNGNLEAILIGNDPLILSVTAEQYGVGPGLWFLTEPGAIYVSYMEAPETITPMLPKYLPGVCLPKVIDLTKYTADIYYSGLLAGKTFNDAALCLFVNGGGSITVTDNTTFWEDVPTDSPVRFVFDVDTLAPGITIEAEAKSRALASGVLYTIETSFLVTKGGWSRATVVFFNCFNGTTDIVVAVDPITIPGETNTEG